MNGRQLLIDHKQEILSIAAENGIVNVRLFGSTARDEDRNDSDIDFLVEVQEGRTLFDLIRFKQSVEDLLGKKVDVVSDQALHYAIRNSIMDEAIQL